MKWIDAHCHLSDSRYDGVRDKIIERSCISGVESWIEGGVSPSDWDTQQALKAQYPSFFPSYGLHPWWVVTQEKSAIDLALGKLESRLKEAIALGELGLDFGKSHGGNPEIQLDAFIRQLEIATSQKKPLILHVVKAHSEVLSTLKGFTGKLSGIVHSFSGDLNQAKAYLDLGLTLSIGGGVTRDGFRALKWAVASLPTASFVIETDAPDQLPNWQGRGELPYNEPAYLIPIAEAVGALQGRTSEEVLDQSAETLKKIFGI